MSRKNKKRRREASTQQREESRRERKASKQNRIDAKKPRFAVLLQEWEDHKTIAQQMANSA